MTAMTFTVRRFVRRTSHRADEHRANFRQFDRDVIAPIISEVSSTIRPHRIMPPGQTDVIHTALCDPDRIMWRIRCSDYDIMF